MDDAYLGEAFRKVHGEPNFVKFIETVIKGGVRDNFNIHWEPYVNSCDFCNFNYTVISKLETMKEDMEMILKLSDIDLEILSKKTRNRKTGEDIEETTKNLFSELTRAQGETLESIYSFDFEMFGYEAKKYLDVTKN